MYLRNLIRKQGNEKTVKVSVQHLKFDITVRWGEGGEFINAAALQTLVTVVLIVSPVLLFAHLCTGVAQSA
jgi:hypothetical protein